jgi:hypothetical protein
MADSAGVRIDGIAVAPPSRGGAEGHRSEPAAGTRMPRRAVLLCLAVLVAAAVGLTGAVHVLRVQQVAGQGQAGRITATAPCPPGRSCAISAQPSAQMLDAASIAFPGLELISTTVEFDAATGLSYSESMTLSDGAIVIRLTATREPGSVPREVFVDVTAASSDGVIVMAVPADGVQDRMTVAALSGPEDALLPVDAAVAWASIPDLLGPASR